jgi:DnaJ-class molecular chaperone
MPDQYCRKCRARLVQCPRCEGKGTVTQTSFMSSKEVPCPNCGGTGKLCPKDGRDWG